MPVLWRGCRITCSAWRRSSGASDSIGGRGGAGAALPHYLLGVSAFLLHIGLYARLAALGWLAESSVRRLSYATAVVGAMVVGTVGLSLCGIHILQHSTWSSVEGAPARVIVFMV